MFTESASRPSPLCRWLLLFYLLSWVQLIKHPMDCRQSGSSIPEISQARILEYVAIPFSRGLSHPGTKLASLAG